MERKNVHAERGFTLAEIVIAVLVLSTAMIVFISLQSAAVDRTLRDNQRQRAMLAARSILAALETRNDDVPEESMDDTLPNVLKQIKPLSDLQDWNNPEFERFRAQLVIQNWEIPIPGVEADAVKRVSLRIYWSDSPLDSFPVTYFIPKLDEE